MAKINASSFVGNGSLSLYLNNEVVLKNSESASLEIADGSEFVLHWFVQGNPGSPYSITISSPKDAQLQFTRVINRSGKDFGGFSFST